MWNRVWTRQEIEKRFGAQHMAHILSQPNPIIFCECRAAGAWDANDSESYSQYNSLANILRSES